MSEFYKSSYNGSEIDEAIMYVKNTVKKILPEHEDKINELNLSAAKDKDVVKRIEKNQPVGYLGLDKEGKFNGNFIKNKTITKEKVSDDFFEGVEGSDIPLASTTVDGKMSKEDKIKLDALDESAVRYGYFETEISTLSNYVNNRVNNLMSEMTWRRSVGSKAELQIKYPNPQHGWVVYVTEQRTPYVYLSDYGWMNFFEDVIADTKAYVDDKCKSEFTSIILKSSTPDSAKKFRITITDDGTLSATEIE